MPYVRHTLSNGMVVWEVDADHASSGRWFILFAGETKSTNHETMDNALREAQKVQNRRRRTRERMDALLSNERQDAREGK